MPKKVTVKDDMAAIVEAYQKSLGLSTFTAALHSMIFRFDGSNQPTTNQQPINQQKPSAIDDLDGLF
jgi:hypothetical protein